MSTSHWSSGSWGKVPVALSMLVAIAGCRSESDRVAHSVAPLIGEPIAWSTKLTTPSPGLLSSFILGARGSTVVLVDLALDDNWVWNGTAWSTVGRAPTGFSTATMIADTGARTFAMFGGGTTFEWATSAWVAKGSAAPGTLRAVTTFQGKILANIDDGIPETWLFDGSTWAKVATTGPTPRCTAKCALGSRNGTPLVVRAGTIVWEAYEFDGTRVR